MAYKAYYYKFECREKNRKFWISIHILSYLLLFIGIWNETDISNFRFFDFQLPIPNSSIIPLCNFQFSNSRSSVCQLFDFELILFGKHKGRMEKLHSENRKLKSGNGTFENTNLLGQHKGNWKVENRNRKLRSGN